MWHEINIIGRVGREPELRYTADGKASCSFSVASNRKLPNGNEEIIWFKITAWDKMAENINQLTHKGMTVHVVGRLVCTTEGTPRTYTRKDGTTAAAFEVVAKEFRIIDFKTGQQQQQRQSQPTQRDFTEDIPW